MNEKHYVKPGAKRTLCQLTYNAKDAIHRRYLAQTSDEVTCPRCRAIMDAANVKPL